MFDLWLLIGGAMLHICQHSTEIVQISVDGGERGRWRGERLAGRECYGPMSKLAVGKSAGDTEGIILAEDFHLP